MPFRIFIVWIFSCGKSRSAIQRSQENSQETKIFSQYEAMLAGYHFIFRNFRLMKSPRVWVGISLIILLCGKLSAQSLPGDLMYRDSFPGVKSCLVKCISYDPKDSIHDERYSYKRYTYMADGRKSGSTQYYNCGKDIYKDSTFDSVVYTRDGLVMQKIEYSNFFGKREKRIETYSYDERRRVRQISEKYELEDRPHTQTFIYDDKGRVSIMTDTTKFDTVSAHFFYSSAMKIAVYEPKNNYGVIDTTWYNENGDVKINCIYLTATENGVTDQRCWDSVIYEYSGRNLIRKTEYEHGDLNHTVYEYDKQGRIITVRKSQEGFGEDYDRSYIVYDNYGNIIERRTTTFDNYKTVETWNITYNKHGLPVHAERNLVENNFPQSTFIYDYTYTYY
jgi:hypothetical protein